MLGTRRYNIQPRFYSLSVLQDGSVGLSLSRMGVMQVPTIQHAITIRLKVHRIARRVFVMEGVRAAIVVLLALQVVPQPQVRLSL